MKRIDLISKWLQDRRRTYADGLSLFLATATPALLAKYASPLKLAVSPHEFSIEFTTLINKLTEIRKNAIAFPAQFPSAYEDVIVLEAVQTLSENEIQSIIEAKQTKRDELLAKLDQEKQSVIEAKRAERDALLSATPANSGPEPTGSDPQPDSVGEKLKDLSSKQEDNTSQIEDNAEDLANLQEQFDELSEKTIVEIKEQIDSLSMEIDELKKPGVKFIKESSLPAAMAKNYNRIKEIVPLMASMHSDLTNETLTDEQRKDIATQLCDLDDEKRSLWDAIDKWSESTGVNASALRDAAVVATAGAPAETSPSAPESTVTDGGIEAGVAIARRRLQVKQNIIRSQEALKVATAEGNEKAIKSAQTRLDKYQAELTELQIQIKGE